jgi:hypothetical protein
MYNILARVPQGNSPLGRPRYRWEGNIKIHIREIGHEGLDDYLALVNTVMNLRVP